MCRPRGPSSDEKPLTLVQALKRLRAVALVSLIDEGLFSFAIGTTHYPYLRTLVECGAGSKGWSGSPGCGDRDVVLERGARLGGAAMAVVVAGNIACALAWAPAIDGRGARRRGRAD